MSESQWISTKDRLPKRGERVLVHISINTHHGTFSAIEICWIGECADGTYVWVNDDICCSEDEITHWMPLPDKPRLEKELIINER